MCPDSTHGGVTSTRSRVVDLTHPFNSQTLYWPNAPSTFKLEKRAYRMTEGGYFYSSFAYSAPEHGGTHLDAPIHFNERGRTADQVPLEQLIGADTARLLVNERRSTRSAPTSHRSTTARARPSSSTRL